MVDFWDDRFGLGQPGDDRLYGLDANEPSGSSIIYSNTEMSYSTGAGISRFGYDTTYSKAYEAGLRFTNITLDNSNTVEYAAIKFKAGSNQTNPIYYNITAESDSSSVTFSTLTNYDARTRTSSVSGEFSAGFTSGSWYNTVDVSSLLQTLIELPSWATGNAVTFFITPTAATGNNFVDIHNYDFVDGSVAPVLDLYANVSSNISTTIGSDAFISINLLSDAFIPHIINSDSHIWTIDTQTITSDTHVWTSDTPTITSDAFIATELLSDAFITHTITSDAFISTIIPSDAHIYDTDTTTITSDAYIAVEGVAVIRSDAHIWDNDQVDMVSDATVVVRTTITLNSDATVWDNFTETITSDGHIYEVDTTTSLSDAHIWTTDTSTMLSNAFMQADGYAVILSDAHIWDNYTETITSDSNIYEVDTITINSDTQVSGLVTITSDAVIYVENTSTITSDSQIYDSNTTSITSDATITKETILSSAHIVGFDDVYFMPTHIHSYMKDKIKATHKYDKSGGFTIL